MYRSESDQKEGDGETAVTGIGLILFPYIPTVWLATTNTFVMGIASGYVMILLIHHPQATCIPRARHIKQLACGLLDAI